MYSSLYEKILILQSWIIRFEKSCIFEHFGQSCKEEFDIVPYAFRIVWKLWQRNYNEVWDKARSCYLKATVYQEKYDIPSQFNSCVDCMRC